MYIAEWSVVKDIGEAKLHPFFIFFSLFFFFLFFVPIQETANPSPSDSVVVNVNTKRTEVDRNPYYSETKLRIFERTSTILLIIFEHNNVNK